MFYALRTNRPLEVIANFDKLGPMPFLFNTFRAATIADLARAHHLLGQHHEELAVARRLSAEQAVSGFWVSHRLQELAALAALGRVEAIDDVLSEVFASRTGDHIDSLFDPAFSLLMVARELAAHGFEAEAPPYLERLVEWTSTPARSTSRNQEERLVWFRANALDMLGRASDGYQEVRSLYDGQEGDLVACARLGVAAARAGDRPTAEAMSALLAQNPNSRPYGIGYYYRACIAARLGQTKDALGLLHEAMYGGFIPYIRLHRDPDLESLRNTPEFQELIRPKG
jgi:hypothetical protein